jgi:hypothetical protein
MSAPLTQLLNPCASKANKIVPVFLVDGISKMFIEMPSECEWMSPWHMNSGFLQCLVTLLMNTRVLHCQRPVASYT